MNISIDIRYDIQRHLNEFQICNNELEQEIVGTNERRGTQVEKHFANQCVLVMAAAQVLTACLSVMQSSR